MLDGNVPPTLSVKLKRIRLLETTQKWFGTEKVKGGVPEKLELVMPPQAKKSSSGGSQP